MDEPNDTESRLKALEDGLKANTVLTKQIADSTRGIVEFMESLDGLLKLLNWVGKWLKPIGIIASAIGAIWVAILAFKSGTPISPK